MSSATGRKPTDAGSLLTGRRRIPSGDAANAANPVNAQHLPDCSTADSPAPQALSTPSLPTLPRQATPDVLPQPPSALTPLLPLRLPPPRQPPSDVFPPQPASLTFCSIKNRHPFPNDDFSSTIFFNSHPKHDPHTHPNHYFFFSILFRISSRYFSKNPGIFTPSR